MKKETIILKEKVNFDKLQKVINCSNIPIKSGEEEWGKNIKVGDSNDSVKMTEVKNVLKKNSDFKDKDVISIIYLMQEIFPEVEYKFDNIIDGKRLSRTFHKLANL